jgi:hypothetical protein
MSRAIAWAVLIILSKQFLNLNLKMDKEKKYYYLKLNPPRATFPQDISPDEAKIMAEHSAYWKVLLEKRICLVYGPVFDPKGFFGIGIIAIDNEEQLSSIINNDPAGKLGKYEFYPMRAIFPS